MTTLKDLYIEELQDLWSANDQMKSVVSTMAGRVKDTSLGDRLRRSADGIEQHTDLLRSLIEEAGGESSKEHCKGMEGLVKEAKKHALDSNLDDALQDLAIIAQYQRMCHYGIAGFGTAKAFAEALGKRDAARKLDEALAEIYRSDEYMSDLAEKSRTAASQDA